MVISSEQIELVQNFQGDSVVYDATLKQTTAVFLPFKVRTPSNVARDCDESHSVNNVASDFA